MTALRMGLSCRKLRRQSGPDRDPLSMAHRRRRVAPPPRRCRQAQNAACECHRQTKRPPPVSLPPPDFDPQDERDARVYSSGYTMLRDFLPLWTWLTPIVGWLLLAALLRFTHPLFDLALGAGLVACVLAAVHHAETVAHRVGEPFGTLILALAVTVIEAALIVSMMLAGGDAAAALARDTIFAAVMIILNGMVGLCLLLGGSRHGEQVFGLYGVNAALATLATM